MWRHRLSHHEIMCHGCRSADTRQHHTFLKMNKEELKKRYAQLAYQDRLIREEINTKNQDDKNSERTENEGIRKSE